METQLIPYSTFTTMITNKRLAKIYRDAAGQLDDDDLMGYCCYAIDHASLDYHEMLEAKDTFEKVMGWPSTIWGRGRFSGSYGWYGKPTPERREARWIALCLAAAIVESGGL
jgi:hypothetical protein